MRETRTAQLSIFDFYAKHEFGDFLSKLSSLLDEQPELIELLEGDLIRDDALPTGRKGLSVESVLRCLEPPWATIFALWHRLVIEPH